ncbi:MAG: hypothetical protein R6U67_16055 [Sodalinema sp.]|uniref:hypothetical protein n=1 Tax=Sodalinema sp. TaxID=3080550 RepID=UPI001216C4A4|nr:MAG: hypothetical protein EYR95_06345 [Phormidium sp. SL48-SHIP]
MMIASWDICQNSGENCQLEVAHLIKTDGNVGATFHLEPNHNPRSGEPAQTWFALTQSGGESVSLDECDCQLEVFRGGDRSQAIATPTLTAISAEGYEDIPGAEVIFPEAGVYDLVLTGSPQNSANFEPFSLSYNVTVRPGRATAEVTSETETRETATSETQAVASGEGVDETTGLVFLGVWGAIAVAGVVVLGGWAWKRLRSQ